MPQKPKILVVGSLVMDLIVSMERFPNEGETVLGKHFKTAPGGKGANQAVQTSLLGAETTLVGKVGNDDFGKQLISVISHLGVNTERIKFTDSFPTAVGNIQIETCKSNSKNRICVVPGANMALTYDDIAFLKEEIDNFDMVMLQLEIPMDINLQVAKFAFAKNIPIMLNPAPFKKIPNELLPLITYVSPNEHEAFDMCGIHICDIESAKQAVKAIAAKGIDNVIITLGSKGAIIGNQNRCDFYPSVNGGEAIDPTAAGDSFIGAFCTAICLGYNSAEAMKFANATASITVTKMGAMPSLPTYNEVNNLLEKKGNG